MKVKIILVSLMALLTHSFQAAVWHNGTRHASFSLPENHDPVVAVAAAMFSDDIMAVTGHPAKEAERASATIRLYQLDLASDADLKAASDAGIDTRTLLTLTDGFSIREKDGVIHIAGANGSGTAYGLLEMSRKAGVSPWIWWGDVVPAKKTTLEIEDGYSDLQWASVERRGIYINNEDWSLLPWSYLTFEPSGNMEIGPKTYRKIFELLLRLRANTLWSKKSDGSIDAYLSDMPDNFSQMWTDDNFGYLTSMDAAKDSIEGVVYHLSHSGEPHDYLWLTTTQPGLIWNQMRKAYDSNVRKLWIANVHDPKISGYDLELFMDMAWNINSVGASSLRSHYKAWLTREFGEKAAETIFPVMHDFYRLCGQRRPEFMGWSQVEKDRKLYERGLTPVRNTDFNPNEFGDELQRYVDEFDRASYVVDYATKFVDPSLYDAYFASVIYPVCTAAAHARSMLKAQEARTLAAGRNKVADRILHEELIRQACAESLRAYQEVRKLTEYYNDVVTDGKWKYSMDLRPRDLPVFSAPSLPIILTEKELLDYPVPPVGNPTPPAAGEAIAANADSFARMKGSSESIGMLGHSMNAVAISKGSSLTYEFTTPVGGDGVIRIALIPTHAIDGKDVRFSVSLDGNKSTVFNLKEPFRSEQWKQNVLRGQAIRTIPASISSGKHSLEVKALDDNIVLDQWMWDPDPNRCFYVFPTQQ